MIAYCNKRSPTESMRKSSAHLLLLASLALPVAPAASCDSLSSLALPATTITVAESVAADRWPAGVNGGAAHHGPFCRVAATLRPTSDSDIKIEVWMPASDWNGNVQAVGNGGWSGSINYTGMGAALAGGYATASTDTGHTGSSASFASGHPEKLIDFAYRSEHLMSVQAKAIVAAFYGKAQRFAYWNGCSAGGKQGLKEAQLYPRDFDGIVAGSPAANWTGRAAQAIWVAQAVHKDEASYIPPEKYAAIHRAVLSACDRQDGVEDGVLESPTACRFDPKTIECKGSDAVDCLTAAQVEAARKIYAPSTNPRTAQRLYAGLAPGSEMGWATWGGPRPLSIASDYFRFVVFESPSWDFLTLNFDADIARAEKMDATRLNATEPNLRPFFSHGGKLLQYHGWSDPQISPGNSVDYYQSVRKELGEVGDSYRMFMVPGMAHCGGGDGTSTFDAMSAVKSWVEEKHAPDRIEASRVRGGKVDRKRPLCPYPQVASYKGSGSTDDAGNFVCRADGVR
jgi:feruloyl esterase